jgi:2,4-didehydro-3-deoxy-L-rhamnonate hydrolase
MTIIGEGPAGFRLGTFSGAGNAFFPGLVLPRGLVVPLDRLTPLLHQLDLHLEGAESVLRLLSNWNDNFVALDKIASVLEERETLTPADLGAIALDKLHLHAPIHVPRQIFCTIANYRSHIIESVGGSADAEEIIQQRLRGTPYACFKLPSTVIGPTDPLEIPHHAQRTDWEIELGVVIGAPCRRATRENAMSFVAGYTLVNDITIRELVSRPDMPRLGSDWLQSKNSPGFLPTGPFLVPAAFVSDPYALRLQLTLNGELMQSELASDMLFDIAAQIAYLSQHAQLLPGDIICTGTPAGCGTRYQRYLKPGDLMECTTEGFGVQRTRCIVEQTD